MKRPYLYYSRLDEIAFVRDFEAILGITTTGYGSTQLNGIKESNLNQRLVRQSQADFFAKIKPQHGDKIIVVEATDNAYYQCDALIACYRILNKNPLLISNTADCPTIAITDKRRSILSLIHSGWRGTSLNIVGKTIAQIHDEFYLQPENLEAYVWPGICKHDYKVGQEFKSIFPKWVSADNKLNLKGVIIDQLLAAGIKNDQLHASRRCSYCSALETRRTHYYPFQDHFPMFYSYRRVLDHFSQYDQPLNPKQEILKRHLAEKRNCVFMTFKTEK